MIDLMTDGGRRIFLLLPFRHGRKMIKSITLGPVMWEHTLKWQDGDYGKSIDLLFDIAEESAVILRKVRYPDVDRVMEQFFSMLPPEIREAIAAGTIPKKVTVQNYDTTLVERMEQQAEEDFGEPVNEEAYTPIQDVTQPVRPKFEPVPVLVEQPEPSEFGFEGVAANG